MAKPEPIKVCLTNQGEDTETPWAEDLGPAPGHPAGARKVRLINVPFMHAKPTWGDTIVVTPVEDGFPTWDRGGAPWAQIGTRIAEDGGRWAMIVDYAPHPDAKDAFGALAHACAEHDVVCEGAWGPRADGEPGRAYLAVKNELGDAELMKHLREASLPCELVQIHPEPMIKPRAKPIMKRGAPKPPVAGKPAAAVPPPPAAKPAVKTLAARPAAQKTVATKPAAVKPVAAKPAAAKVAAAKAAPAKAAPAKAAPAKPVAAKPTAAKKAAAKQSARKRPARRA